MTMLASSQLQMIVQQHAQGRPNTSPSPTGMFADLKRPGARSSGNGVSANPNSNGRSSQLRPLPPTKGFATGGGGGGGGFSMMISGSKTGEEKVISLTEKREATQIRPAAAERKPREKPPVIEKPPKDDPRDKQIKKLELELKRAKATILEKTKENDTISAKVSTLEGSLSKQEKKNENLKNQVSILTSSNEAKDQEIANLQAALTRHEDGASSMGEESRKLTQEIDVLNIKLTSAESKWSKEKASLEREKQALLDELAASRSAADAAKSQIADGQSSLSKRQELLEIERQQARERESVLKSEVAKAKKQLEQSEKKLAEWKSTVENCNSYILNICQPSFSVVKDENLTPVQPGVNTPDGGGFVLVPLPLLLEGYGLLPGNLKQQIAKDYEKSKQSEGANNASAGSFVQQPPASRGGTRNSFSRK